MGRSSSKPESFNNQSNERGGRGQLQQGQHASTNKLQAHEKLLGQGEAIVRVLN